MTDELDALKAVLDLCETRKLSVGAISVGSIRLVLALPTAASAAKVDEAPAHKPTQDEKAMAKLRIASRKTFGRVLPDEELLALEGALA